MTLERLKGITLEGFEGADREYRRKLFLKFEELYQALLVVRLPCSIFVNGSFLTEKGMPRDLDAMVLIDFDVMDIVNDQQRILIDDITGAVNFSQLDVNAYTVYPIGHEFYGTGLDPRFFYEAYGMERSEKWLKGYATLRLWETDVGLRLYR